MAEASRSSSLAAGIADLHPAYFSMVMATGIVSIACQLRGMHGLAVALMVANVVMYIALLGLNLIRLVRFPDRMRADLLDHHRCVGFFTFVAGTCVLGNQFLVVVARPPIALALWLLGIVSWAAVTYTVLTVLTVKTQKPALGEGISGAWLVAVVAAQAVALLGGLLLPHLASAREVATFFSLTMWLGGGMLYIWIIALIFYRYTFFLLDPRQLAPPYWINMGAMAISTLAGTLLIDRAPLSPLLGELLPFLKGLTLLFWATATWWIPLLIALGIWRHLLSRVPLSYDVVYWSAVFPLGMYTACTHRLVEVFRQEWLDIVPRWLVWVALIAWGWTFLGLVRRPWPLRSAQPGKEENTR